MQISKGPDLTVFMTSTTNSGSLEDCHSNVFLLTELSGLKWVQLTSSREFNDTIADDPVLQAFGQCLNDGYLVAWRRSPPTTREQTPPLLSLNASKELWIFWYADSEEPSLEKFTQAGKLQEAERGQWDSPTGINYSVKTLLFRALHNVIERTLLSHGFLRYAHGSL